MDAFLYAAYPLLGAIPRGAFKIVTIHSGSFIARFERGPSWRRTLLRRVLGHFDRIVTVNQEQRNFLERIGIERPILVIPAFLPPVARESFRPREAIESLAACGRIIVSSGYGLPYYGFSLILDAVELLAENPERIGVLLCMYNTYDESYVTELGQRLATGRSGLILRDLAPEEFAWLLQRCDVYIRATDRDGDAVAIREAAFYGKTVIASDCVERPPNVELFSTGDADSLAQALRRTAGTKPRASTADGNAGLEALLAIYHEAPTT